MPRLPVISWLKVVKALTKIGYKIDHQTGSHIILMYVFILITPILLTKC